MCIGPQKLKLAAGRQSLDCSHCLLHSSAPQVLSECFQRMSADCPLNYNHTKDLSSGLVILLSAFSPWLRQTREPRILERIINQKSLLAFPSCIKTQRNMFFFKSMNIRLFYIRHMKEEIFANMQ